MLLVCWLRLFSLKKVIDDDVLQFTCCVRANVACRESKGEFCCDNIGQLGQTARQLGRLMRARWTDEARLRIRSDEAEQLAKSSLFSSLHVPSRALNLSETSSKLETGKNNEASSRKQLNLH